MKVTIEVTFDIEPTPEQRIEHTPFHATWASDQWIADAVALALVDGLDGVEDAIVISCEEI